MSKNKKNKIKKSKSKSKSKSAPVGEEMAEFIRERIIFEGVSDVRSEIDDILERIREGDASPNEIDSVLQEAVEELADIVHGASMALNSETRFVAVGE